jgi:hypothetical protein
MPNQSVQRTGRVGHFPVQKQISGPPLTSVVMPPPGQSCFEREGAVSTDSKKQLFLRCVSVNAKEDAIGNSLRAAFRRNPTYAVPLWHRAPFREAFTNEIIAHGELYRNRMKESEHNQFIQDIAIRLSAEYGSVLQNGSLRIGIVQKALNLYLKIIWCLDPDWPIPPHCPIDRRVLSAAGINGNWTQLDSIAIYKDWVSRLRAHAARAGYSSLAQWELDFWNA